MKEGKLNDLDYNVLAILLDRELSGYDVTQRLKHFRKTSHSRIYPVLAKLEGLNYVVYRDVQQAGKPDKKLYKLTPPAIEILREWVADMKTARRPKVQDEAMVSLLCLHLLDEETSIKHLDEKNKELEKYGQKLVKALEEKNKEVDNNIKSHPSQHLVEIIQTHITIDRLLTSWLASTIKKDIKKPHQSLREYIKENL